MTYSDISVAAHDVLVLGLPLFWAGFALWPSGRTWSYRRTGAPCRAATCTKSRQVFSLATLQQTPLGSNQPRHPTRSLSRLKTNCCCQCCAAVNAVLLSMLCCCQCCQCCECYAAVSAVSAVQCCQCCAVAWWLGIQWLVSQCCG